jgi:hypothetical protein
MPIVSLAVIEAAQADRRTDRLRDEPCVGADQGGNNVVAAATSFDGAHRLDVEAEFDPHEVEHH